jgi:polyisoprenoid-binding protein YceI
LFERWNDATSRHHEESTMSLAPASPAPTTRSSALAGEWTIDASHSAVHFQVRHMMVATVRGRFGAVSGRARIGPGGDLASATVEAEIDATSIDTRDAKRDEHLRSADFFDVANHPKLSFRSTRIEAGADGSFQLHGDLTIRGTTKPVVLDVAEGVQGPLKNPWGMTVVGASATTKINRKDFGLNWNAALEAGGFLVGDDVKITIDVELVHQK